MTYPPLHYKIAVKNFGAHVFHVSIKIKNTDKTVTASMPRWIPGSYKIREYARNIFNINAQTCTGKPIAIAKDGTAKWQFAANGEDLIIQYSVYAFDLSVRGAYLDDTRFFFNHCAVFMDVENHSEQQRFIEIATPDTWTIFTTLPKLDRQLGDKQLGNQQNHCYMANSYAEQIDFPVECSQDFLTTDFEVEGIPHQMTYTGRLNDDYLLEQTAQDVEKICQAQIKLFNGLPLDCYHFLTFLAPNVYGGLEHLNSTALMASPAMMLTDNTNRHDKYIDFLGLCSHEYFHLWNIKRLCPKDFMPYKLDAEQPTEMLWLFEGFTAYYDELMLCRSGVIGPAQFLQRLGQTISRVIALPGRFQQSLAESSHDAWVKLYHADENARNFMISYYSKGSLFACYLDLWLRKNSDNQSSLDTVMQILWRNFACQQKGVSEPDVIAVCKTLVNVHYHPELLTLFNDYIHGIDDIPLADILPDFAIDYIIDYERINGNPKTSEPGFKLKDSQIIAIDIDSEAAKIGLSVQDKIIAINNQPIDNIDINKTLYQQPMGKEINLSYSRLGQIYSKTLTLAEPQKSHVHLQKVLDNDLNKDWLACWINN